MDVTVSAILISGMKLAPVQDFFTILITVAFDHRNQLLLS